MAGLTRRQFIAIVGGVVVVAVAGVGAYMLLRRPGEETAPSTPTPTATTSPTSSPPPATSPVPSKITIPALFDKSGPTSDVGVDYAWGAENCVKWVNEVEGGILLGDKRVPVELIGTDYAYKVPEAVSIYEQYKSTYNPAVIIGWGTGDTEALAPKIAEDKIVYISASYSSHLDDPKKTPYNFYPVCSYSDQARAAMMYIKEWWEKHGESRPPKLVCAYDFNVPYCRAPIEAIKSIAEELGIEVGPDQNVGIKATDTSSQVLAIKNYGADFVWFGNTTATAAVFAKDAKKLDLGARIIINIWGHDENLIKLAGEAAEGIWGMTGHYYWGFEDKAPGLRTLKDAVTRFGPHDYFPVSSYIRGWLNARMAILAIEETFSKFGEISGEKIKQTLESWKDKELPEEGILPPITYTPTDHRPNTKAMVLTIENGKYKVERDWIDVGRRPDWLGW